jgi:hypothetical protein
MMSKRIELYEKHKGSRHKIIAVFENVIIEKFVQKRDEVFDYEFFIAIKDMTGKVITTYSLDHYGYVETESYNNNERTDDKYTQLEERVSILEDILVKLSKGVRQ